MRENRARRSGSRLKCNHFSKCCKKAKPTKVAYNMTNVEVIRYRPPLVASNSLVTFRLASTIETCEINVKHAIHYAQYDQRINLQCLTNSIVLWIHFRKI